MFFRREKPRVFTFAERLQKLRELGFRVQGSGPSVRVIRDGCAAGVVDRGSDSAIEPVEVGKAGVLIGAEIGALVDQGFQKVLQTPGGERVPALAHHLEALHSFQEDLKEGLGLKSLYNESLGTVNALHLYDRVAGRDAAPRNKPWQRKR